MQLGNINKMDMNEFLNELSEENLNFVKDSFNSVEDAFSFYRKSALESAGRNTGEFMGVEEFFNGLNNISSTEFI